MTKRTVTIELASGLEARPIAMLVQLASSYESTIYVQSDNKDQCEEHYGHDDP